MKLLRLPLDVISAMLIASTTEPVPLTDIDFYSNKLWILNHEQDYSKCKEIVIEIANHTQVTPNPRMIDIPDNGAYPIQSILRVGEITKRFGRVEFVIQLTGDRYISIEKPYEDYSLAGETNKQLLTYIRQDIIQAINHSQCTCSRVSLFT